MNEIDVKIVTTRKQYLNWPFGPTFKRDKQFRNETIVIKKEKIFTIIVLKINMVQNGTIQLKCCYKVIVLCIKLKLKIFMTTSPKIRSHLTSVIIEKINNLVLCKKVLWDFLIVEQIFLSPQVKRRVIINNKLVYTSCRAT